MDVTGTGSAGVTMAPQAQSRELRYDLLLDCKVIDSEGHSIGRLEEARAELIHGECRVVEFHVGGLSVLERIGSVALFGGLIRALGGSRFYRTYAVPADQMDFSDPKKPRVTRPVRELRALE
jgi:hypothetical protein